MDNSFETRNKSEAAFFDRSVYRDVPTHSKGTGSLRTRLAQRLDRHLKKELPNIQKELNSKHGHVDSELKQSGERRPAPSEQKRFLMAISTAYQTIVDNTADGDYEYLLFGTIDPEEGFEDPSNMRRTASSLTTRYGGHILCSPILLTLRRTKPSTSSPPPTSKSSTATCCTISPLRLCCRSISTSPMRRCHTLQRRPRSLSTSVSSWEPPEQAGGRVGGFRVGIGPLSLG